MNPRLAELLVEIEQRGVENDERETDRSRRMLNLERDTARLVSILARSSRARRVLEVGTSNGYSTIWLASAVADAGGRVVSIDRNAEKQAMARENLRRAGLADSVELRLGEASAVVQELSGPFDLVFFDGDRTSAPEQLGLLLPKLAPAVLVLADNVFSHPAEIAQYLSAVTKLDGFDHVVVPIGKGLSLSYRGSG
jgi:predicted O-methyltransferase YrrM